MATSLIRSRAAITGTKDRFSWNEIAGGAVLQEDGIITAVGTYEALHAKHPTVPVIGTGREVLLPGFVNGHHHIGLTPVQLGSPDMPLELWFITRLVMRNVDLYLDTLYSAFEMIGSGITTVQRMPSAAAPQASAAAWLPAEIVISPRSRSALVRARARFRTPRALNDPVFWRFSALSSTAPGSGPPASAMRRWSERDVKRGVRCTRPRITSAARRTSSWVRRPVAGIARSYSAVRIVQAWSRCRSD